MFTFPGIIIPNSIEPLSIGFINQGRKTSCLDSMLYLYPSSQKLYRLGHLASNGDGIHRHAMSCPAIPTQTTSYLYRVSIIDHQLMNSMATKPSLHRMQSSSLIELSTADHWRGMPSSPAADVRLTQHCKVCGGMKRGEGNSTCASG